MGVASVSSAYQFIHGGMDRLMHCGRMMWTIVCRLLKASPSADSHWPVGIELMAPRTISLMFPMTGREKAKVALIQSGIMTFSPDRLTSTGRRYMTVNRITSHGAFRKRWVTTFAVARRTE